MLGCSAASGHLATVRTVVETHTASSGMPPKVTRQDRCICSKAGHSEEGGWDLTASSGLPPLSVEWGFNVLSLPALVLASRPLNGGSCEYSQGGGSAGGALTW